MQGPDGQTSLKPLNLIELGSERMQEIGREKRRADKKKVRSFSKANSLEYQFSDLFSKRSESSNMSTLKSTQNGSTSSTQADKTQILIMQDSLGVPEQNIFKIPTKSVSIFSLSQVQ